MPRRSVTFIELITALAIMSIISATVGINFSLYDSRRLEVAGRIIAADMALTGQMAATYHRNYTVYFDIANDTYSIYNGSSNPANLTKRKALGLNLVTIRFPRILNNGSTTDVDLSPSSIRFNFPQGSITRADGNPISPYSNYGNPVNIVLLNITAGNRYAELMLYGDTGLSAYYPGAASGGGGGGCGGGGGGGCGRRGGG
jgi:hypothetical protein